MKKWKYKGYIESRMRTFSLFPQEFQKEKSGKNQCLRIYLLIISIIDKTLKSSDSGIIRSDQNKLFIQWNTIQQWERNYNYIQQREWIFQTYCWVQDARYKSMHTIFFHFYEGQKQEKLISSISRQDNCYLGEMSR